MSTVLVGNGTAAAPVARDGVAFAAAFAIFVAAAASLATTMPITLSIAIVFLFAGPHNWLEARYMLGRLPARAGRLAPFFVTACGGVAGLSAAFIALPWSGGLGLDPVAAHAAWNATFVVWVAALVMIRSRINPRFDAHWALPAATLVALVQCPWPTAFGLALMFLHPVVALAVLDRELRRLHPAWVCPWRLALAFVPAGIIAIWMGIGSEFGLSPRSGLEADVVRHAGIDLLAFAPPRPIVATHVFLELVHYGVWIVVLPLVGMRSAPWRLDTVPIARRSRRWARVVAGILTVFGVAVIALWACFVADYATTRHVYFTIAVLHVLAEIPFLLRPG